MDFNHPPYIAIHTSKLSKLVNVPNETLSLHIATAKPFNRGHEGIFLRQNRGIDLLQALRSSNFPTSEIQQRMD